MNTVLSDHEPEAAPQAALSAGAREVSAIHSALEAVELPEESARHAPPSSTTLPHPSVATAEARAWQSRLIGVLAKADHQRCQLAGTRLAADADYILDKVEAMVQQAEDLAKATAFREASGPAQMEAMAKAGAFYVAVNDARRPNSRSLFHSMISAFAASEDASQVPAVRDCLDQAWETLHAHFTLFTAHYPTSLAARGWVDAATAFLADFKQSIREWPEN